MLRLCDTQHMEMFYAHWPSSSFSTRLCIANILPMSGMPNGESVVVGTVTQCICAYVGCNVIIGGRVCHKSVVNHSSTVCICVCGGYVIRRGRTRVLYRDPQVSVLNVNEGIEREH